MTHVYEALASAFIKEGVKSHFTLMGDGNMYFVTALADAGAAIYHARHEHCAVGMAVGYHAATGDVATASVTSGPGVTQIVTILTSAAANKIPLVILAGETPIGLTWHTQQIDQAAVIAPTGARYIAARSQSALFGAVREAFFYARKHSMPVVVGVPYDMQEQQLAKPVDYIPSAALVPPRSLPQLDENVAGCVAQMLANAERPIIIGGKGAMREGAAAKIRLLAERSGALLANTLPARGLFDDDPFSLGVVGGFATELAREQFKSADFILAIGASLAFFTVDGGKLFPQARVVQIAIEPPGLTQGQGIADVMMCADAEDAATWLTAHLGNAKGSIRTQELASRIATTPADPTVFNIEPDQFDPRQVVRDLDAVIPKDWDIVSGTGHSSYFYTHMWNRPAGRYHVIREFGAIGNSLSVAMGIAAARGNGKVLLLEGDGSLLMHIQELETINRHNVKLLIGTLNDGAYGAEIHKLRESGVSERGAIFGQPNFSAIAQAFGLDGATPTTLDELPGLLRRYEAGSNAAIWNFRVSRKVISPRMLRQTKKQGP